MHRYKTIKDGRTLRHLAKRFDFTYDKKEKTILSYNDSLFVTMLNAGYKFMYILPNKKRYLVKLEA